MACQRCVLLWAVTWYVLACKSALAGVCYSDGMGWGANTMQRSVHETAKSASELFSIDSGIWSRLLFTESVQKITFEGLRVVPEETAAWASRNMF